MSKTLSRVTVTCTNHLTIDQTQIACNALFRRILLPEALQDAHHDHRGRSTPPSGSRTERLSLRREEASPGLSR